MLVKELLKFFSNINLHSSRKSFSVINSSGYRRFYFRNIHVSANVWESGQTNRPDNLEESTFRKYIEKNNHFKRNVSEITNLNFSLDDKYESLKLLVKLKENVENDCLWQEMFDCLRREVSNFDVEDFLKIIALASDIKVNKGSQNMSDFIEFLDNELRIRTFELNDMLEILYVLKHTLLMGKSLRRFRIYLKLFRSVHRLHKFHPLQAVHIFYYLEGMSETARADYKHPLLKYAKKNISQLKIDEVGIVLAALIRAKLFATDVTFIQQIIDKLLDEIERVNSAQLFYISRFLLNCSSVHSRDMILDFQGKLIPHISRFNPKSLISALLSGYPFSLNMSFWNNVVERLKTELKTLPVVDIERMTSVTTAFKIENKEEFLKLAVEAIEERENLEYCSKHFINFCKHLVLHRVYPKKLLDIVVSKDFIESMVTRSFSKEIASWAFLNYTLQVDKPECQCACLDEVLEKKIMKGIYYNRIMKNVVSPFKIRIRLGEHLKAIFGNDAVIEAYCLPHLEKVLVMRFDKNLNATIIPQNFQSGSKAFVHAPLDQHFWICFIATFIPSDGPGPLQDTYMRHLSAFGYKPILVENSKFFYYAKLAPEELKKFVEGLIQQTVEESLKEKQIQKN